MLDKRVTGALAGSALVLVVGMVLRATEVIDRWVFIVVAAAAVLGPLVVMSLVDRARRNPRAGPRQHPAQRSGKQT